MAEFSRDEVATHCTIDDCYVIIYNKVFNITEFMKSEHSGGFVPLSIAGFDATNLFISTHPTYVNKMIQPSSAFYKKYFVGDIIVGEHLQHEKDNELFEQLKIEVNTYMKENGLKPRDNDFFLIEIFGILCFYVYTFFKLLSSQNPILYAILHGLSWAFLMPRAIHDTNHGGLTKDMSGWKRALTTFIPATISSNSWWQNKHNMHHMHTNADGDPDIVQPIRLSKYTKIKPLHRFQVPIAFFGYCLFAFQVIFRGRGLRKPHQVEPSQKSFYIPAKMVLAAQWFSVFYSKVFFPYVFSLALGSFYVSLCFTLSHNQYHLIDEHVDKTSFLRHQASSTTDYNPGSQITNVLSHGLNHQLIHHLFPSINYHYYPRLTTDVLIPFLKKHDIKYNGNITFPQAFAMHVKFLHLLSKE
jgi:linoleoyl-CoA desaturase